MSLRSASRSFCSLSKSSLPIGPIFCSLIGLSLKDLSYQKKPCSSQLPPRHYVQHSAGKIKHWNFMNTMINFQPFISSNEFLALWWVLLSSLITGQESSTNRPNVDTHYFWCIDHLAQWPHERTIHSHQLHNQHHICHHVSCPFLEHIVELQRNLHKQQFEFKTTLSEVITLCSLSVRLSPSSRIAVLSCSDYSLTSSANSSGCRQVYENLPKIFCPFSPQHNSPEPVLLSFKGKRDPLYAVYMSYHWDTLL